MNELKELLEKYVTIDLISLILSGSRAKAGASKISIRPVLIKERLVFQASVFDGNRVFHENLERGEAVSRTLKWMRKDFKQLQLEERNSFSTVLVSKKGTCTVKTKKRGSTAISPGLTHNRTKKYILEEGKYIPFLADLGVMNEDGRVLKARYDKFKQINRFLEFIEDILPQLAKDRQMTILDFGCGKSYLTFAMYYYLKVLKSYDIRVIGMDLKEDVIEECSRLSVKYGFEHLQFITGDIASFDGVSRVDMVVTLHACDTATDYALKKAVKWGAQVILSVPCCQHELNRQIHNEVLGPILRYGLIKERISALVTDALRAELLEQQGYDTQILEFIDIEHTPKNIMIRAIKKGGKGKTTNEYVNCREFLGVSPILEKLLGSEGEI